jgi:molybdopterin/thiamine biosynthesis adenylyltransferase
MTEAQIQRYARHVLLPDVGGVGQHRLLVACVAVDLGDGDPAAAYAAAFLAAAGVGCLRLRGHLRASVIAMEVRDGPLLGIGDIGEPRGAAFARAVAALNPDIRVTLDDDGEPQAYDGQAPQPLCERPRPLVLPYRVRDPLDALIDGSAAAAQLIAAIARGTP